MTAKICPRCGRPKTMVRLTWRCLPCCRETGAMASRPHGPRPKARWKPTPEQHAAYLAWKGRYI